MAVLGEGFYPCRGIRSGTSRKPNAELCRAELGGSEIPSSEQSSRDQAAPSEAGQSMPPALGIFMFIYLIK